ncbi:general secretion pathway protein GspM [Geobacter sp. SVR]|uniref:general secretion pathway protein GspM n=1 Tax=Geobacter sp. SVR TaxID=2495594 RepID=UPI00143EF61E|nr:general secretion pathway protein GspM [Geobacter sp. SVR]BCS56098.1 type II secretion system protein GspM [Geobacter sp. SVR]GCF84861.1 type II secretion system protein GspM [Geobacter sp. SVR]
MRFFDRVLDFWRNLDSRMRLWAGCALIAVLAVVLGWSALAGKNAQLERKRKAREAVLKELMPLRVAYRSAKLSSDTMAGRLAAVRPEDSPAKVIEEIGIRGKGVKIAPVKGERRGNIQEDAADVSIEGLTANEAINLIYRLEKGGRPLLLKKSNLRVRFDDPSRFDLSMTVALLKPAPGSAK